MGATAIGTGINSPPGYAELVTKLLAEVTGLPVRKAENLVEATQDSGAFAQMSGTMKRAAVQISKICNDLRWLSSGPRCGLNEINLPPMQPGSSIMPGKVNPVIPELVNQICYQIIGYDAIISMAAEASELELNMAEPIIAYDLLHGMMILKNACITLTSRCIVGHHGQRRPLPAVRGEQHRPGDGPEPGARLREVGRHRQGGAEDRRQRLRPGPGEEVAYQRAAGRSAQAREHDRPAADRQIRSSISS